MKLNNDTKVSKAESLKWVIIICLIAISIVGNSYYSDELLLYRLIGIVILSSIIGFLVLRTTKGEAFLKLTKEARIEIHRVTWPTKQETLQTTGIVLIVVFVMSLIFWGVDSFLSWIISSVIT